MQTDSSFLAPGILWVTSAVRPPLIRRSARIRSASACGISATERRLPLGSNHRDCAYIHTYRCVNTVGLLSGGCHFARRRVSSRLAVLRMRATWAVVCCRSWGVILVSRGQAISTASG